MPTHALLGATGATGSAILRALLANPPANLHLNILVRSKQKLLKSFPDLETTKAFTLSIIEGPISGPKAMATVLRGADVVYMVVATNDSSPGVRIARDAAEAIIAALRTLKDDGKAGYHAPTILVIRSCTISPTFAPQQPYLMHTFVHFALYNCYSDLDLACQHYAAISSSEPGLFDYIYVDPPAIHDSEGTEPTGHELMVDPSKGKQSDGLNYADLGCAFVEIAERRAEFRGESVAVSATGKVRETWGVLAGYLVSGLKGRIWG